MVEDTFHCFLTCVISREVSVSVLEAVREDIPNIPPEKMMFLDYGEGIDTNLELALTWLLSSVWLIMWENRRSKKTCKLYEVRSDLEARCNLLRETRFKAAVGKIMFFISKMSP